MEKKWEKWGLKGLLVWKNDRDLLRCFKIIWEQNKWSVMVSSENWDWSKSWTILREVMKCCYNWNFGNVNVKREILHNLHMFQKIKQLCKTIKNIGWKRREAVTIESLEMVFRKDGEKWEEKKMPQTVQVIKNTRWKFMNSVVIEISKRTHSWEFS